MNMDRVVAVTGANGYIGSHVVQILLDRGYHVRAGAREPHNTERIGHLEEMGSRYPGQLDIVSTDVLEIDDVRNLMSGCSDLIHTAATVMIRASDPQSKIVNPSLIGTQNVIAALKETPSVMTVVHTSSTAAIRPMRWENGATLTTDTWADDATIENNPYGLAKVLAEREIRKWHEECGIQEGRVLRTLHPCMVFGPPLSKYHLRGSLTILMMLARRSIPAIILSLIHI